MPSVAGQVFGGHRGQDLRLAMIQPATNMGPADDDGDHGIPRGTPPRRTPVRLRGSSGHRPDPGQHHRASQGGIAGDLRVTRLQPDVLGLPRGQPEEQEDVEGRDDIASAVALGERLVQADIAADQCAEGGSGPAVDTPVVPGVIEPGSGVEVARAWSGVIWSRFRSCWFMAGLSSLACT